MISAKPSHKSVRIALRALCILLVWDAPVSAGRRPEWVRDRCECKEPVPCLVAPCSVSPVCDIDPPTSPPRVTGPHCEDCYCNGCHAIHHFLTGGKKEYIPQCTQGAPFPEPKYVTELCGCKPEDRVNCFADPCEFATCDSAPLGQTAVCKSCYCTGCDAVWYYINDFGHNIYIDECNTA